jgi:hypothetical protein
VGPEGHAHVPRAACPPRLWRRRLAPQAEWSQADILMVTDGEIPNPDEKLLEVGAPPGGQPTRTRLLPLLLTCATPPAQAIARANKEMGLEVHGLLVSSNVSQAMRQLCTGAPRERG